MPWEVTRGHCDSSAPCVTHYSPLRSGLLAVVRAGCVVLGCEAQNYNFSLLKQCFGSSLNTFAQAGDVYAECKLRGGLTRR